MVAAGKKTARDLLEVTTLLMRSFAARMRQGDARAKHGERLEPAHIGILARVSTGDRSLSELAQHQSVRLPTMSKSVALLVRRGWLERWIPENNRRTTMVRATAEGRRVFASMKREAEGHVARLLETLSAAERARVDAGLKILIETLDRGAQDA
jgi:DNA-binding MarR family transcriptional regulator